MKTILLFFGLLLSVVSNAQNITFPDPNFKQFLLNSRIDFDLDGGTVFPLIDANNDLQISQQEASAVIRLHTFYTNISDLEGLQFFTNLKSFESLLANVSEFNFPSLNQLEVLSFNNISTEINFSNFSVAANTNLKKLTIGNNNLTSLDLSPNVNLTELNLYSPSLTALNLNNLSSLRYLYYYGKMATIDISDCVNLLTLFANSSIPSSFTPEENQLTSIDLSNQSRLINLYLAGNNLTSLDLSACTNLEVVDVSGNQLTTLNLQNVEYVTYLDCQRNQLSTLNVNQMFNLNVLDCSFNQLTTLYIKNGIIEEFLAINGNIGLTSICCDENEIVYLENESALNGIDNADINSNCNVATATLRMYPNPIVDLLHLESDASISKIEVFGINSLLVMQDESGSKIIDMSTLQAGIYFLKVYKEDAITTMKFVKS